jgi:hypothetical protein
MSLEKLRPIECKRPGDVGYAPEATISWTDARRVGPQIFGVHAPCFRKRRTARRHSTMHSGQYDTERESCHAHGSLPAKSIFRKERNEKAWTNFSDVQNTTLHNSRVYPLARLLSGRVERASGLSSAKKVPQTRVRKAYNPRT